MKKFKIIVCVNEKLAIGRDNSLIYCIHDDMQNFAMLTTNNVVIMGKKTYLSLPDQKTLKNRINIVMSSDKEFGISIDKISEGSSLLIVESIEDLCEILDKFYPDEDYYVIGGASIYKQFLLRDLVDEVVMTYVHDDEDGDTYFPIHLLKNWKRECIVENAIDPKTSIKYDFIKFLK